MTTTTITLGDDGRPLVEIVDAAGEIWAYKVDVDPEPAPSCFAAQVLRTDTGSAYRIAQGPDGRWSCGCPDFVYRRFKKRQLESCKHVLFLSRLTAAQRAALAALAAAAPAPTISEIAG
jgi:hypothetical protein